MSKTHIRTALVVVVGIFLLAGGWDTSTAQAEVAKTTKNTRVMERRGEKSRVITRVPPGKTVKVLARQGRWVKIRYGGRSGWVTRTSLAAAKVVRTKRRRAFVEGREKQRDFDGGGPGDRVGADAVEAEDIPPDASGEVGDEDVSEEEMLDEGEDEDVVELASDNKSATRTAAADAPDDDELVDEDEDAIDDSDVYEDTSNQIVLVKALKANLHRQPTTRSKPIRSEVQGAQLTVLKRSTNGKWLLVENAGGDQGWVRTSLIGSPDFSYPKMLIRAGAHTGYSRLSQSFASDGNVALSNYNISASAASMTVAGDFLYRATRSIMVDVDVAYTGSYSSPGIHYEGELGPTDIAFLIHEINAGAAGGYNFNSKSGMVAYLRAGYHYSMFQVQDFNNFGINQPKLPSEILQGPTVGAHLDIPRLSGKFGVRVGGDALLPLATREQTVGLRDGELDSTFAAWAGARVAYQMSSRLNVEAGYRFAYAKSVWTGESDRPTEAQQESARTDITHILSAGLGAAF